MKENVKGRFRDRAVLLGLCFPQAWMYIVSKGLACRGLGFQLAFHAGICVCLVAIALLAARWGDRLPRRGMVWVSTAGMVALSVFGLIGAGDAVPLGLPVGFVGGASVAVCFALWFEVHCQLPLREAFCYILLGFSGGALGCLLLSWIAASSVEAALACSAMLPLLSCAAFRQSRHRYALFDAVPFEATGDESRKSRHITRQIAFLLAQVVIYVLVFGNGIIFSILQSASLETGHQEAISQLNYGLRFLLPILMVLWFLAERTAERRSYRPLANAVLLAMVFVLLAFWFLGGATTVVAYGMVSVSRNLVLILVYLLLLKLVRATGKRPFEVFGIGRGLYEAAVAVGIGVYAFLAVRFGPFGIEQDAVYLTAFCVFVFLTSCLLATLQSLVDSVPGNAPDIAVAASSSSGTSFDDVAKEANAGEGGEVADDAWLQATLADAYQLSERELEIVLLFSRGHSKKRIAQMIVLSENTVRWHLQQIYAKLGIHSRDELIELLEAQKNG